MVEFRVSKRGLEGGGENAVQVFSVSCHIDRAGRIRVMGMRSGYVLVESGFTYILTQN